MAKQPNLYSENSSCRQQVGFTEENLKQYAVLKAMGATPRLLLTMILTQAGLCALLGTGLGLGLCAIVGQIASRIHAP